MTSGCGNSVAVAVLHNTVKGKDYLRQWKHLKAPFLDPVCLEPSKIKVELCFSEGICKSAVLTLSYTESAEAQSHL